MILIEKYLNICSIYMYMYRNICFIKLDEVEIICIKSVYFDS